MTTSRRHQLCGLLATTVAAVLAVTGCAHQTPPPTAGHADRHRSTAQRAGAGQVVWQVSTSGGMVPQFYLTSSRPSITVYGDGLVVLTGQPARRMGAAPRLLRGRMAPGALRRLVAAADKSHLFVGRPPDFGMPRISDLPSTMVSFRTRSGALVTRRAYALDLHGANGLTARQRANRRTLLALIARARRAVHVTGPYVGHAIDVYATSGLQGTPGKTSGPAVAWPGPPLAAALRSRVQGASCVELTGPAAARVQTLADTHHNIAWTDHGTRYRLAVIPLLPGERTSCPMAGHG